MDDEAAGGHSYGGYTALAVAGAQIDLRTLKERCAALDVDDPNKTLCVQSVEGGTELAQELELRTVPAGLWPQLADSRVTAVVSLAGDSYMFGDEGLSKISIPMMAVGGTADSLTPYDWGVKPAYELASSEKKALVSMQGGEHFLAVNLCADTPYIIGAPAYRFVCIDPVWDRARALDLTFHFTTAFLREVLMGDSAAREVLLPERVAIPGVAYEAVGFNRD